MSNQDEQKLTTTSHSANRSSVGFFIIIFFLTILTGALAFGFWQGFQLEKTISDLKINTAHNQSAVYILQQSVDNLRLATDKALNLSVQQEQMINDWKAAQKGNLNKWYVAEAQYLVKLANDHLQFTHNTSMALTLLQRADQVLQSLQDTGVLEIRKSLAEKIKNLQDLPKVEITGIYVQLATLNNVLDKLPLPASPLKPDTTPVTINPDAAWWQKGWDQSLNALRKIVIVRNDMKNVLPLLIPEEKVFLYQNLHAQLESATWGVLHRDKVVYEAGLARAINWIQLYFDNDAPETQAMLKNLSQLQAVNVAPPVITLAPTLQLFESYFATAGAV